jgi:hypothetical protein
VRKLFFIAFLCLLAVSCDAPQERGVGGSPPRKTSQSSEFTQRQERSSRRKFGRDWRGRYCEKTLRRLYGLSKKQFKAVKKDMIKKDPSLTTKSTRHPQATKAPASGG